ncbi:ankyrin repeat domain-containing protein [Clostridium sp. HBUAS56010]|uniref:ankyrin repeat domain-containing protein n=1 Tax=Clostridium sp. HBUAS56010 TaxID=2571127 RepID=UPI0011773686|nr:ankyrin repeat domain-containing protein [Clostridium sp. HBUAS56010]
MKKKIIICVGMGLLICLSGCSYHKYRSQIEKDSPTSVSYEDWQLLAAMSQGSSSLERAREAIDAGAEINSYEKGQVEIYDHPRSKDRILLLTPLRIALKNGAVGVFEELIKRGADVNIKEADGKTPLMCVASNSGLKQITMLVEAGADVTYENSKGLDALDYAASSSHKGTDVLEYLLEHGGRVDGKTVNRAAEVRIPDFRKVEYLIEQCEKNGEDWSIDGKYRLHYLAALGTAEELEETITRKKNIDWNETNQGYDSLLMEAASMGNLDTMSYLLRSGADIQFVSQEQKTALIRAVENNQYEAVALLMDSGYEFLPYDDENPYDNELDPAAENGDVEMMKKLFAYGFELKEGSLNQALSRAGESGYLEAVDLLIEEAYKHGLKPDFDSGDAFDGAIRNGDIKTVEYLLEKYHVDINYLEAIGFRFAIEKNDMEMAKCLIAHGVEINPKDPEQSTPLVTAIDWGGLEMVELLVESGADIEQPVRNRKMTPAMIASTKSNRILKYLVEKGVDINKQSARGDTCLSRAVESGKRENVEYLLSIGADTTIKSKDGKTAYQKAKESPDKEIVNIFKKYGKTR